MTDVGQARAHNADMVNAISFDGDWNGQPVSIGFYLVADGMGGYSNGDLASRTASQVMTDCIVEVSPDSRRRLKLAAGETPAELLAQATQRANKALLDHRQTKGDLGSTVTTALVVGDVATIGNVGDSRAYLLRAGRLGQITRDHSLVARLVETGRITPEEARTHPQRNMIYRSLGDKPEVEVDIFTSKLERGDVLLLCSDGLWEMVTDDEILRIIESARDPQKACDALIEAANRAGGEDNIGVIVVEME